jgi:hypothetical protein
VRSMKQMLDTARNLIAMSFCALRVTRKLAGATLGALLVAAPAHAVLSPTQLLARYQPAQVLHPDEAFRPVAVTGFLRTAVLDERTPAGEWVPGGRPLQVPDDDPPDCTSTPGQPCWRLRQPGCTASTGVSSVACYAALQAAQHSPNVVYGAVHRSGGRIALQYWYWYLDDFWSGEYPPSDYVWQTHEGDWEVVTVILTRAGRPLLAGYSEHGCGKRRPWARVPKLGRTHPLVYVALGSHANYFEPGPHPLDLRPECYPALGAAILLSYLPSVLDRTARGPTLGPPAVRVVPVTGTAPRWMRFPGAWGEANFFHAPEPVGTTVAGPAPEGPVRHALWRDPIRTVLAWPGG